ncbi:MAG TPA: spermidine/putrescine ABC transporter substrate-binding protein [Thermoanaerobaculia bacterium]|nr:spermidine/putrescine ABC transporter substrate-binding protein [Thermoanaerobaculia bacterium]
MLLTQAGCGSDPGQPRPAVSGSELNLYNWSEYIPQDILDDFSRQTGCKVNLTSYEDLESMIAELERGGDARYDVVVPSDFVIPTLIDRHLLAPLRKANLPNVANIATNFLNPPYDPGNLFTVPYLWGTTGIFARAPVPESERSWGLVFDPTRQRGRFTLMDSKREMIGPALLYLGYDPSTTDKAALARAEDLLVQTSQRSVGFFGGVESKTKLVKGEADLVVSYNGDALRGMEELPSASYFVPREGGNYWVDNLAIPARAPHRDLAERFLNFLLDPQVGARLANYNHTASPNRAAEPFLDVQDRANPVIYPSRETLARLSLIKNLGSDNGLYDQLWSRVRGKSR